MKINLLRNAFLAIVIFLLAGNAFAQEAYNLSYKFSKGKTYVYKNESTINMTQEVMGREMKVDNSTHNILRFEVNDVASNGDADLTFSFDSAVVKSSGMGKDTTITLTDLIGKKVNATVSSLGEVKNYKEVDSVKIANMMMSLAHEVKQFFARLSGKEVKVGETWNNSMVDTMKNYGGAIIDTMDFVYTLAGKENKLGHNCFKIPFTGNLKIQGNGNMQGINLFIEGTGKATGTIYFDEKDGMLIYSESNMDNDITMATSGAQSMVIPITQSTKTIQSLISD